MGEQAGTTDASASVTTVYLPISRLAAVIWGASSLIVAAGIVREVFAFISGRPSSRYALGFIRLDGELTLPAWYSSSLLLICAMLLIPDARNAYVERSKQFTGWLLLAIGFVYLSLDEALGIHELVNANVGDLVRTTGALTFGWVLVAIPALVVAAILLARFVLRLPRKSQILFVAAGAMYVTGAVGFEMVSAAFVDVGGMDSAGYIAAMVTEEALEIFGVSLFLTALLLHARGERRAWLLS